MSSEHVIVECVEILDKVKIEEAYEKIVAWIAKSGGKVDKKKRSSLILYMSSMVLTVQ